MHRQFIVISSLLLLGCTPAQIDSLVKIAPLLESSAVKDSTATTTAAITENAASQAVKPTTTPTPLISRPPVIFPTRAPEPEPSQTPTPSPTATPTPVPTIAPTPTTVKTGFNNTLSFVRDFGVTSFEAYHTSLFDLNNGNTFPFDSGNGYFAFSAYSGTNGVLDGYRIEGVDSSVQGDYRMVRFFNLGIVTFNTVKEAPEFGYNSPLAGKRSYIEKLSSGQVIAFKIEDKNLGNSYGKILLRDITSDKVTFDTVWQTNGSRQIAP
jgi:hypothetical protein